MKFDASGLESHVLRGGVSDDLLSGFPTAPSFEIPGATDVSLIHLFFRFQQADSVERIFLTSTIWLLFCFSV